MLVVMLAADNSPPPAGSPCMLVVMLAAGNKPPQR